MSDFEARISANIDQVDSAIQSIVTRLQSISNRPITPTLNTRSIDNQLSNIEDRLRRLSNIPINIGGGGGNNGGNGNSGRNRNNGGNNGINDVNEAYKDLMSTARQISQLRIKMPSLNLTSNSRELAEFNRQLTVLQTRYQEIISNYGTSFSASQMNNISRLIDVRDNSIAKALNSAADTTALKSAMEDYKNLLSLAQDISKVSLRLDGLDPTKNAEQITTLRQELSGLLQDFTTLWNNSSGALNINQLHDVGNVFTDLNRQTDELQAKLRDKSIADGLKEAEKAADTLSKSTVLSNRITKWMNDNQESCEQFRQELETMQARLENNHDPAQLHEISNRFKEIDSQVKASSSSIYTFGSQFGKAIKMTLGISSVYQVFNKVISYMKAMVKEAININDAMTQFRIVTTGSSSDYDKFYSNTVSAAKEIGGSVSDLITSATTYARLGFSMDESSLLAKYTNMLQNVGDIDVSSAQNAITAIVKAFDIDISQMESVMDKLVTVGNNFPIGVSELAEGMNNAGSMLASAGNSFDQSLALLTAANTTVQNISKASTGLRTIAARIRNTKTELDDLGESMTDAEYNNIVQALTGKNVSLTDANGELRSTYDIIRDISAIWDDMSSMDQAALAETLAGTRQQNIFFSLIEQFQEAQGAMESMSNSTGTFSAAYSEYMDSVTAHINQFKAAVSELSTSLFESNFLNFFIDLGTGIVNSITGISSFITSIGGLRNVLIGLNAVLLITRSELIATNTVKTINNIKNGLSSLIKFIPKVAAAWKSLAAGTATAQTAMTATLPVIGLILAGITALSAGISLHNTKIKEDRQKTIDSTKSSISSYNDLMEQYRIIKTYIDQTDLTTEEEEAFKNAVDSVSSALGGKTIALDAAKSAQDDYLASLDGLINKEREASIAAAREGLYASGSNLTDKAQNNIPIVGGHSPLLPSALSINTDTWGITNHPKNQQILDAVHSVFPSGYGYYTGNKIADYINPINSEDANSIVDYYYKLLDLKNLFAQNDLLEGNTIYDSANDIVGKLSQDVEDYVGYQYQLLENQYLAQHEIPKTAEEFYAMRDAIISATSATGSYQVALDSIMRNKYGDTLKLDLFDAVVNRDKAVLAAFEKSNQGIKESLKEWYDSLSEDEKELVYNVAIDTDTADFTLSDWEQAIQEEEILLPLEFDIKSEKDMFSNVISAIKSSVSELGLDEDQITNLTKRYASLEGQGKNLAALFEKTENGIHLNSKALGELESAYEKQQKSKLDDYLKTLVSQYNDLTRQIEATGDASGELGLQRDNLGNQIANVSALASQYAGLTSSYNKWKQAQSMGEEGDMYDDVAKNLKNIKELYDDHLIGTNQFRAAVQMMTDEDLTGKSADYIASIYEARMANMEKYFTEGSKGIEKFISDVKSANQDWIKQNESGAWVMDFGVGKDKEVADALGISTEAVQMMLRKLKDYGAEVHLDSLYSDLGLSATSAEEALSQLDTKIAETNQKIAEGTGDKGQLENDLQTYKDAKQAIENISGAEASLDVDTMTLDEAKQKIEELYTVISTLNGEGINIPVTIAEEYNNLLTSYPELQGLTQQPITIDVEATDEASGTIEDVEGKVTHLNEGEANPRLGADDSEAMWKMPAVQDELQELDSEEAKPSVGANDSDWQSKMPAVHDELLELNGERADPTIGANDEASPVINAAKDSIESIPEDTDTTLGADDNTSTGITEAEGNLEAFSSTPYDADINVVPLNLEETDNAIQAIADKPRNAVITVEEKPVTGNEPDYVDNTYTDEEGHVYGYSGLLPYQTREPDKGKDNEIVAPTQDWQSSPVPPAIEPIEVETTIDPSAAEENAQDWKQAFLDAWNNGTPGNAEVPVEAESPESVLDDVQEVAETNPVEIEFTANDVDGAVNAASRLIGKAEEVGVGDVESGIALINNLRSAYNALYQAQIKSASVEPGDSSGAAAVAQELQSAASEYMDAYKSLSSATSIIEPVDVDAETDAALAKIQALADVNPTAVVSLNSTEVDSYDPQDKNATVNYGLGSTPSYNPPDYDRYITYHIRTVGTIPGNAGATGTAHASGTAMRNGDWRVHGSGEALGGEVGEELVVFEPHYIVICKTIN